MLSADLIDEEKAVRRLSLQVHGADIHCPQCKELAPASIYRGGFVRCPKCRKKYTWRTGTVFEGTKLNAATLILLLSKLINKENEKSIASSLLLSLDTVKLWQIKLDKIFKSGE